MLHTVVRLVLLIHKTSQKRTLHETAAVVYMSRLVCRLGFQVHPLL